MSPEGQTRAQTFVDNEKYRSRDQSVNTRGERQKYQDVISRTERLGFALDEDASGQDVPQLLEEPHMAGLLEAGEDSDAHEWEEHRKLEDMGQETNN